MCEHEPDIIDMMSEKELRKELRALLIENSKLKKVSKYCPICSKKLDKHNNTLVCPSVCCVYLEYIGKNKQINNSEVIK